jgi:hypothetical protein
MHAAYVHGFLRSAFGPDVSLFRALRIPELNAARDFSNEPIVHYKSDSCCCHCRKRCKDGQAFALRPSCDRSSCLKRIEDESNSCPSCGQRFGR